METYSDKQQGDAIDSRDEDFLDGLMDILREKPSALKARLIKEYGADYERLTGEKPDLKIAQLSRTDLAADECPVATTDVEVNLKNRKDAIEKAQYGPANPNEPNEAYWKAKADEFQGDVESAKKMLCGNCGAFDRTSAILDCIKTGIGDDAEEVIDAGVLGYCEIFDFKCASKRTCRAWIAGGPITDEKRELKRTISQTPAKKSERIKGSSKNPSGTASTRSSAGSIDISESVITGMKNKLADFRKRHPNRTAPSLGALKKVYRRGSGAFSTSHRPNMNRAGWAMARVNKFLRMAGGGVVKKAYREADGDLLSEFADLRCWDGYERVEGKVAGEKGSCQRK